jgi:PAS domain S-box-containing protein
VALAGASPDGLDIGTRLELLDRVGCGIWLFDGTDTRYVNNALAAMTGYTREELLAPGFFGQLIHPDYTSLVWDRGTARVRGEQVPENYEAVFLTKSGEPLWLELHAKVVELPIGTGSLVSAVDVSARKKAEEAYGESVAHHQALVDTVQAHVITTDARGRATFVNRHWLDYTGLTLEESLRRGTADVIHPEDVQAADEAWRAARRDGEGYQVDYRIRASGGEYRWQSWRIQPVRASGGETLGWTGVGIDIHDAKSLQLALSQANEDLLVANRFKDDFLGLVSHELRTPLTTMRGLTTHLLRRPATDIDVEGRETLAQIESDALRLQSVIENLLLMARIDSEGVEFEPVLLARLADSAVANLRRRYDRKIEIIAPPGLPPVLGVADLLRMVIENLAENAVKYSPKAVPVTLKLSNDADRVQLSVMDRGPGIRAEDRDRIFEPFYRSREATASRVSGLGLGLTVCNRILQLHCTSLELAEREGGGACIGFSLPACIEE